MGLHYTKRIGLGMSLWAAGAAVAQISLDGAGEASLSFGTLQNQTINVTKDPVGYATFEFSVFLLTGDLEGLEPPGVIGVNYYLQIAAEGSGFFHINDRTLISTILNDPIRPDGMVESGSTPDDDSTLAVRNGQIANPAAGPIFGGWDLGASDGLFYVGSGQNHELAHFTLGVSPFTPNGEYVLTTVSPPEIGWDNGGTHEFTSHGSLTVIVVPEPAGTAAGGLAALLAFAGYRRWTGRSRTET